MDNATLMFFYVSYVGVTLLLGVLPADDGPDWIEPRSWLLIPLAGGIIAAPTILLLFALLQIPVNLGWMSEDAVLPGTLWIWTALMVWFRIGSYLEARREQRAAPRPAAGKLPRYQKAAFGLSGWRARKDAGPAAAAGSDWPMASTREAACPAPSDAVPHHTSTDQGCDAPTSSATSSSSGGWDSGSDGGGDSGSSD